MTERLETVLDKVSTISNPINSSLIQEFYQFMADNRKSDSHKKNNIKAFLSNCDQDVRHNIDKDRWLELTIQAD